MKISTIPVIEAPVDMSSSIETLGVYVGNIVNYSIQLVFTGSPVGSFKLQMSADPTSYVTSTKTTQLEDVLNWTDVTESVQAITEAGDHMWNVQNCGNTWTRVVYTPVSGSGSLTVANFTVKGV